MSSSFARNDWIRKVEAVLDTKGLPPKERNFLTTSLLYFYDVYRPIPFCNLSKEAYCQRYLEAVQRMESFRLFPLSSINEDSLEALTFQKFMFETERGNFRKNVSGLFEVSEEGNYACATKGLTISGKRIICLDLPNDLEKYRICHHELTHILQGKYAFSVPAKYPFAFEFVQMCMEGEAVSYEPTLGMREEATSDLLCTKETNYLITDHVPYPLYHTLYHILEKWIGKETLEVLRKNEDSQMNPFETVRKYAPNCPIEEVYANMINILQYYNLPKASYSQEKVDALKKSISTYRRYVKHVDTTLQIDLQGLEGNKNYFKQCKEEQTSINRTLNDPQLLEEQFLKEKQKLLTEIEEDYQQQRIPQAEYLEEKKEIEMQLTLDLYRETICERSHSLQTEMKKTEGAIQEGLQKVKVTLSHRETEQRFSEALERVFGKHLTLQDSFTYLTTGEYPKKKQDTSSSIEQMVQNTLSSNQETKKNSLESK